MGFWDFFLNLFKSDDSGPRGGDDDGLDPRAGRGTVPRGGGTSGGGSRSGGSRGGQSMSSQGRDFLTELEGSRSQAYRDVRGLLTIGVGHLITQSELSSGKIYIRGVPVKWRNGLSNRDIDNLLAQDLERFNTAVNDAVTVNLRQYQFDSLVSFSFNVGPSAFRNSTLLKVLNQGNYNEVPNQFMRWVYSNGKKIPGLVHRRKREVKLWNGEI